MVTCTCLANRHKQYHTACVSCRIALITLHHVKVAATTGQLNIRMTLKHTSCLLDAVAKLILFKRSPKYQSRAPPQVHPTQLSKQQSRAHFHTPPQTQSTGLSQGSSSSSISSHCSVGVAGDAVRGHADPRVRCNGPLQAAATAAATPATACNSRGRCRSNGRLCRQLVRG